MSREPRSRLSTARDNPTHWSRSRASRLIASICLLPALLIAAASIDEKPRAKRPAAAKTDEPQSLSPLPIGERLVYRAYLRKAGIEVEAGTAAFTLTEEKNGRLLISSVAEGSKFGYSLASRVRSSVDPESITPSLYHYLQTGSEDRQKKLMFSKSRVIYLREKHCMEPNCQDSKHFVKRRRWAGLIPKEKRWIHCPDRDCEIESHHHWKIRHRHEVTGPHYDMLSAIYFARTLDLRPGMKQTISVVDDHDIWQVEVQVYPGGIVETPAGTRNSIKIILEPKPAAGERDKEDFSGLFGMSGNIRIWLDAESKRPLKVQGKLPFAFTNLQARVELVKVGRTEKPCDL